MWYGFGGRLPNAYLPEASVVVVRVNPDTGLLILTSTACITPPVGSLTVPWSVPAPPSPCPCATVTPSRLMDRICALPTRVWSSRRAAPSTELALVDIMVRHRDRSRPNGPSEIQ